jgi:hypothetical protein
VNPVRFSFTESMYSIIGNACCPTNFCSSGAHAIDGCVLKRTTPPGRDTSRSSRFTMLSITPMRGFVER